MIIINETEKEIMSVLEENGDENVSINDSRFSKIETSLLKKAFESLCKRNGLVERKEGVYSRKKSKKNKLVTVKEFFALLPKNDFFQEYEDFLDYIHVNNETNSFLDKEIVEINDYALSSVLDYGECEGIYLNIIIKNLKTKESNNFITCKTLNYADEDMKKMGELYACFVLAFRKMVFLNFDAVFRRKGYEIRFYPKLNSAFNYSYYCETLEEAEKCYNKEDFDGKNGKKMIIDNKTLTKIKEE